MKALFFLINILVGAISVIAQPPPGPVEKGMNFGEKTAMEGSVNVDQLVTLLGDKSSLDVKVKGQVVDVCRMMGCWLKMQTSAGPVMIKMKDELFFVPLDINGKTVIAQGVAVIENVSVESLRHYAEDAGKSREEIAAIKKSKKEITIEATGILVL